MKIGFILFFVVFSTFSTTISGEIDDDLTEYENNSFSSGKYEEVIYVHYDSQTDTHYFKSFQTTDKCHAINYFKTIVTNYSTKEEETVKIFTLP